MNFKTIFAAMIPVTLGVLFAFILKEQLVDRFIKKA